MSEPDYYIKNGLSPLQAFEQGLLSKEQYVGFCKGNVIKYTIRAGEKTNDPLLDIVKAMDYLHHLHKALKIYDDDGVGDLENKLSEIKNKVEEYKKECGLTDDDLPSLENVLTYTDEDLEYFKEDNNLPTDTRKFPECESDNFLSDSWAGKLRKMLKGN